MEATSQKKQYIIGIDIGGTNTDGVLIDKSEQKSHILQKCKTLTSNSNVSEGVFTCISSLIRLQKEEDKTFDESTDIAFIIIGTTHFINEIIQKSPGEEKLNKVAVIRICGQATYDFESFSFIENQDLLKRIQGPAFYCNGGITQSFPEFQPIEKQEINEEQIIECLKEIKEANIHNVSVNAMGCLVDNKQELKIAEIIGKFVKETNYEISYTLSHHICSKNGLIYRENATVLNETLKNLAKNTFDSIQNALNELNLSNVPFVLSKNDGSFFSRNQCEKYPILCSSASIVNSLKGGQMLYHVDQKDIALVLDIGGTSTDLAILFHGSARESGKHINLGGVQFNSERMPQVSTIALGGGSIVKVYRCPESNKPQLEIIKQSIAKNIKKYSICCNEYEENKGLLLCTSDFAVQWNKVLEDQLGAKKTKLEDFLKNGKYVLEDKEYILDFNSKEIEELKLLFRQKMSQKLVDLIESASNGRDEMRILLCGGGSLIVDMDYLQEQLSENLKVQKNIDYKNVGSANALGATQFDITKSFQDSLMLNPEADYTEDKKINWEKILKEQEQKLIDQITNSGIGQGPFITLEQDYGPTPYGLENQVNIRIKVKGQLNVEKFQLLMKDILKQNQDLPQNNLKNFKEETKIKNLHNYKINLPQKIESQQRNLKIDENLRKYGKPALTLDSEVDFECMSWGAGIFGCGGGGSCELGEFMLKKIYKKNQEPVHIYPVESMTEEDVLNVIGFVGIPSLLADRLFTIFEIQNTFDAAVEHSKTTEGQKEVTGMMDIELGGTNGLIPLLVSQNSGIAVFDGHLMDRAFPQSTQMAMTPYNMSGFPLVCGVNEGENVVSNVSGDDFIRVSLGKKKKELGDEFDYEKESAGMKDFASTITQENYAKFVQDVKDGKKVNPVFNNPVQMMVVSNLINGNGVSTICFGNLDKENSNKILYKNTYQKSFEVGKAMYDGIHKDKLPVEEVLKTLSPIFKKYDETAREVKILGVGRIQNKISDKLAGGQDVGSFEVIGEDKENTIKIKFQNEYLVALEKDSQSQKFSQVVATCPDLISLVDKHNGQPIHSEETVNGLEVICFVMPADKKAKQKGIIEFLQPTIFGEDYEYQEY